MNQPIFLSRRAVFSSGVLLHSGLSSGFDFEIESFFSGYQDPNEGLVVNLTRVKDFLTLLLSSYDHKNLQLDLGLKNSKGELFYCFNTFGQELSVKAQDLFLDFFKKERMSQTHLSFVGLSLKENQSVEFKNWVIDQLF